MTDSALKLKQQPTHGHTAGIDLAQQNSAIDAASIDLISLNSAKDAEGQTTTCTPFDLLDSVIRLNAAFQQQCLSKIESMSKTRSHQKVIGASCALSTTHYISTVYSKSKTLAQPQRRLPDYLLAPMCYRARHSLSSAQRTLVVALC